MTLSWRWGVGIAACVALGGCTVVVDGTAQVVTSSTVATAAGDGWPEPGHELTEPMNVLPAGSPPPFPETVAGYSLAEEWHETVRAFSGEDWSTIYEFPATMNGCDLQRFYIRWRAVNESAKVEVTFLSSPDEIVLGDPVDGVAGWMSGYGCGQPAFRLKHSNDESTLTDVAVEVQRWEVSV